MDQDDREAREAAIRHRTGPLEVMAGHGAGKTTILLERYACLVRERAAWPYEIVLLTFTRRAATEMRERLQLLLGEDTDDLPIFTIHAFAKSVLTTAAGRHSLFRVYDPNQAFKTLRRAMVDTGLPETVWPPTFVAEVIADAKERGTSPEEFVTIPDSPAQQAIARVYARYQELLRQDHASDFADLVMGAYRLLQGQPHLLEQLQMRCRFVMVDEWQDTSLGQYQFIRQVVGPSRNLFVVGSEAQSIYEWRQANYARLSEKFTADFPEAKRVVLRNNFRSTEQIVRSAAALFGGRPYPDVDLVATRGPGDPIQDVRVQNEHEEAAFVADEAARLACTGIPWNEMAVLYRINRQSTLLEHEFMHRQIPYVLPLRQRLYHRREVRDILAYLSLALTPDEAALRQIINNPPRNIGPVSLRALMGNGLSIKWQCFVKAGERGQEMGLKPQAVEGLRALRRTVDDLTTQARHLPPAALIDLTLERTGYQAWLLDELDGESRLNSIRALQHEAEDYHTTAEFLAVMRDRIEADLERPDDEGVALLTIHSAKGLQFRVVFVVGMEEGLLPHARSVESGAEAGERRLAHVAISRACDRLYLVSAQSREHAGAGRRIYPRPSRYLTALPRDDVIRRNPATALPRK